MWQNKIVRTAIIIAGALVALAVVPRGWLKFYSIEAKDLAILLRAGSLPMKVTEVRAFP